jgi:hypothetical protein
MRPIAIYVLKLRGTSYMSRETSAKIPLLVPIACYRMDTAVGRDVGKRLVVEVQEDSVT